MTSEKTVALGPYGGSGGKAWDDGTSYNIIRLINIRFDESHIIAFHVQYDVDGKAVWATRHGGGTNTGARQTVKFDYPTEYLVGLSGKHGSASGFVNCLTFHTNIRQYGPYGNQIGTQFFSELADGGKIVGFHGKESSFIDSIGTHIEPIIKSSIISVGPFGTYGGALWDDGTYSKVRELIIYSGWVIDSFQAVYEDQDGNQVLGSKQGGDGGGKNTVKLDADEYLVSFSGYYGLVDKLIFIRSLSFQSNKKPYGPYGAEEGEKFEFSSTTGGKIIGFHGRSNDYLTAIGAYLDK